MFGGTYSGRRVLLTGHTGFKGSWLALWLQQLGAEVTGLALDPPTQPSHWDLVRPGMRDVRADIRDAARVRAEVEASSPEIVFHLAAQSLVRASYADPLGTWDVNVMGTANILEACRHVSGVRAVVVVTTDKCYENTGAHRPYREDDPLGGHDPYSASKAGAELVVASFRRAFMEPAGGPLVASARAGNVIGGGDWSADRLVPDAVRARESGSHLRVRSPEAVRPWQHVLDPLAGYLLLGRRLLEGNTAMARAWNFGPAREGCVSVRQLLERMQANWPALQWDVDGGQHPHEAGLLLLDASLAQRELGWRCTWDVARCVAATAAWYRAWLEDGAIRTTRDIDEFTADARTQGMPWAH